MGCVTPRRRSPDCLSSPLRAISRSTSSTTLGALTTLTNASTFVSDAPEPTKDCKTDAGSDGSNSDVDEFAELKQRRAEMAAMASRVLALYDAGVPLFTRGALRQLGLQLDHNAGVRSGDRNATVTVCGIDGRRVRLTTQSGAVSATAVHPDIVLVNVKPQIDYWNIEKLTGNALWHIRRYDPTRAFLPLRISHIQEARYRDANGTISSSGSSTVAELASGLASVSLSTTEAKPSLATVPAPQARLNVDELQAAFRRHRDTWEASDACHQLRETLFASLAPQLVPRGRAIVRKIVAFACSSMTEEREGGSARHAVQHAMMLTVRDVLEQIQADAEGGAETQLDSDSETDSEADGIAVKAATTREAPQPVAVDCFAQDPAYDAADRAVLAMEGVSVLEDPYGFLAVDETTVVISVAPSVPVRQIVTDIARPAAMIWGRIVDEGAAAAAGARPSSVLVDDMGGLADPASSRVQQMIEADYAEFDFPRDPHNFGTVDGVAIYVRTSPAARPPTPPLTDDQAGWSASLFQRLHRTLLCQTTLT
ncbi:hypothetical protein SPBR_02633 [Sporothrix brasiliensis 5110]|uniref:SRR1-like domain-containing protein n=1 Tax=Sporothrix brasiliensis 5110 TaxID=1398154 RepID=A0A0C2IV61_9PEZI|nr:uncharacterized protein SPBR_02633 [Sporothrix brasiliensis 5110]KIH93036.1 hypothetical protein SPBR_02633 [Sporothrix brasiliensis 5110]